MTRVFVLSLSSATPCLWSRRIDDENCSLVKRSTKSVNPANGPLLTCDSRQHLSQRSSFSFTFPHTASPPINFSSRWRAISSVPASKDSIRLHVLGKGGENLQEERWIFWDFLRSSRPQLGVSLSLSLMMIWPLSSFGTALKACVLLTLSAKDEMKRLRGPPFKFRASRTELL